MPGPHESAAIWDWCVIGDVTLPPDGCEGHVVVKGEAKVKDDKKSPSGANGGRNTQQGTDLTELELELHFADLPGRWDLIAEAIQAIWPPRGAKGFAHGGTDLINVRDVEVRSVSLPSWDEGKGSLTIKLREYRPASATAIGGGGGAGPNAALTAKLAAARAKLAAAKAKNIQDSAEIAMLEKEVKSLEVLASNASATKTSTSSTPTKQWAKGSNGVPLGEIQPSDSGSGAPAFGEVQP